MAMVLRCMSYSRSFSRECGAGGIDSMLIPSEHPTVRTHPVLEMTRFHDQMGCFWRRKLHLEDGGGASDVLGVWKPLEKSWRSLPRGILLCTLCRPVGILILTTLYSNRILHPPLYAILVSICPHPASVSVLTKSDQSSCKF